MTALRTAIVFLTRVPVGIGSGEPRPAAAVGWFPIVGAVIGAATGGVYAGLFHAVPPVVAAVGAVAFAHVITGAFHLDGLADTADAVPGAMSVERRLEILRDSRLGTYGTAAVTLTIVAQVGAVATLGPRAGFLALTAAHSLGRAAAVALMGTTVIGFGRPARSTGLGVDYLDDLRLGAVIAGGCCGAAIAVALLGIVVGTIAVLLAVVTAALAHRIAHRAFGGIVGDVLGATATVGEVLVLVAASSTAL